MAKRPALKTCQNCGKAFSAHFTVRAQRTIYICPDAVYKRIPKPNERPQ